MQDPIFLWVSGVEYDNIILKNAGFTFDDIKSKLSDPNYFIAILIVRIDLVD